MVDVARRVGRGLGGIRGRGVLGPRVVDGLGDIGAFAGRGERAQRGLLDFRWHRVARSRELPVVTDTAIRIAQYAAGMIDEAQRFLDVALAVARLRVILPDEPSKRRAHLFVGGGWRDTQRFVERSSHLRPVWRGDAGIFGEIRTRGKVPVQESRQCVSLWSISETCANLVKFRRCAALCRIKRNGQPHGLPVFRSRKLRGRRLTTASASPASPGARARASRGCAPTCRSDRGGSRAWRGGRRPCA